MSIVEVTTFGVHMVIIVNPFEGYRVSNGYRAAHLGEDFPTPRIYDYTSASDGRVLSVGGFYREIVVQPTDEAGRDVGSPWRLAEVETIIVSVGSRVKRGQVIGRNAYFRKGDIYPNGAYRSPHMNKGTGATAGRGKFTEMVTHTKAQAAALDAAAAAAKKTQRTVKSTVNALRRTGPGTKYNVTGDMLLANTVGNFVAFAHGPASQGQPAGNDVWFKGISGNWFWSGSFTSTSTDGLTDETSKFADIVVTPPVETSPDPVEELPVEVPAEDPKPEHPEQPPTVPDEPEPEEPVEEEPVETPEDPAPVEEEPEKKPPVVVPPKETPVEDKKNPVQLVVTATIGLVLLVVGLLVSKFQDLF